LPTIIYSGFLGWLELPLWQRLLAFLVASHGLILLMALAWKHRGWSPGESLYYPTLGLTSLTVLLFLSQWHLIGSALG